MEARPIIRPFDDADAAAVREVFIRVNQHLAPDHLAEAFDAYVVRSLREEIDRIADYYGSRDGSFFVVEQTTGIIGFLGWKAQGPMPWSFGGCMSILPTVVVALAAHF